MNKKINLANEIIRGLLLLVLGVIAITRHVAVWTFVYILFSGGFIYMSFSLSLGMMIKKKLVITQLILSITCLFIAIYGFLNPQLVVTFIPYVIGWFALINALIQMVNYVVYLRDMLRGTGYRLVLVLINLVSAVVLLSAPISTLEALSFFTGCYLVFYALVTILETLKDLVSPVAKRKLLRRLNVSVPILISAIIPQQVYFSANKLIDIDDSQEKNSIQPDVEVFFYLSAKGPESLGHVDICFENKIYSYGLHDPERRRLMGTFGDGVLIVCERSAFLNHASNQEDKLIIGYGIKLNEKQKLIVKQRIDELLNRTYLWQTPIEKQKKLGFIDYASRVYISTKAKMYKFTKGKFRTYFVLSTNCVLLADHILRSPQLDLFSFAGIVTPGSYMSFLNSEYLREGSVVIKRIILKEKSHV